MARLRDLHLGAGRVISSRLLTMRTSRSGGPGGQNVNKVSSAIHLRFDIRASSLHEDIKERLLALGDQRITKEGVVIIKAQQFRTQEKNRLAALDRLRGGVTLYRGAFNRLNAYPRDFADQLGAAVGPWPGVPEDRLLADWWLDGDNGIDLDTYLEQVERLARYLGAQIRVRRREPKCWPRPD